jgi:tetratricopeptide (TPR) repeat protein
MVIRLFLLLFSVIFVSCQSSPDSKGENIPNQEAIKAGQKAETNVQFLTKQMEVQPSANLYYLRAKNYLVLHAFGLADQDLENALRDNPGEPAYLALSAQTKHFVEDYSTSIDRAKLTELSSLNLSQNSLLLAHNYFATKQMSLGRFYLQKIDGSLLSSMDRSLLKSIKDYGDSDSTRLFSLLNLKPSDESPLVYVYYEQGFSSIPSLRYQQEILASLRNYPLDPYFMRYWARFLVKMKKYAQAESVYKQVLKVYPKTKSLQSELIYFNLAKQGLLSTKRSTFSADSIAVSMDSSSQN